MVKRVEFNMAVYSACCHSLNQVAKIDNKVSRTLNWRKVAKAVKRKTEDRRGGHSWWAYLVLRVVSETAKLAELQLDAGYLGNGAVGGPAGWAGGAFANVYIREGDFRRGFEGRHKPGSNVFLQEDSREAVLRSKRSFQNISIYILRMQILTNDEQHGCVV